MRLAVELGEVGGHHRHLLGGRAGDRVGDQVREGDAVAGLLELLAPGVEDRGSHAVVGCDPGHVDLGDVVRSEPPGERRAFGGDRLEARVRRRVRALVEHLVDPARVQRRVEVGSGRAHHTVGWPRIGVVGVGREVRARIAMVIAGGDDGVVVIVVRGHVVGDGGGHGPTAHHRERAALAEVVLHVDDDERPHAPYPRSAGGPGSSSRASGGSSARAAT